jgi:hypothetical protein
MKCMAELLEMREVALENERLRQLELDKQAAITFHGIACNTIKFCEEVIAPQLEEIAIGSVKEIKIELRISDFHKDRLGNLLFNQLKYGGKPYVDNRDSYDRLWRVDYSKEVLEKYLADHCLKTTWVADGYWSYGNGYKDGYILRISI